MNWDAIGAVAETVGALSVVATLVYVSIQIRQNTQNARAATELEVSKRFSAISRRVLDDPDLQRIWDAVAAGEELPPEDYRHYLWLVDWFFHMAGGVFVQHRHGLLSDDSWEVWQRGMWGLLQQAPVQEWWRNENAPLLPEFRRYVDDLLTRDMGFRPPSFAESLGSIESADTAP